MALLGNTTVYGTLSGSGIIYDPSGNSTQWNLGYSLASGVSGSLTGYALKSQTGSFITTAQTGSFYAASNPSGFITGVNLSSYATYSQLTGFSGTLGGIYSTYAQLTGLSGYEAGVTNLLATYAQLTGLSGFETTVQSAFATYAQLTGLSGYDATVTNLAATGSALSSSISSLSGTLIGNYLPISGGTLTGNLSINGNLNFPTNGNLILDPNGYDYISYDVNKNAFTTSSALYVGGSAHVDGEIFQGDGFRVINTSETGQFYPASNPSSYITGVSQFSYNNGYDLTGYLLSPTVTQIQGRPIQPSAPGVGQTLQWNGSTWVPGAVAAGGNGGGGIIYYFDFLNQSGLAPSGGLAAGLTPVSLWGRNYSVGSGQYTSPNLNPNGQDILVASFLSASGDPNVRNIPAGLWDFNIWASTDSNNATQTSIKVIVNIYNPSGAGAYRQLSSSDYVYLYDGTTIAQYLLNVTVPQTGLLATERLYVQLFGTKYTGPSRTISLYFDSYRPSHCHTTIPAVAGDGVVKVINGIMQTPATGIFDSDVDVNAQIQQSKILGLTTSLASLYPNSNPSGFLQSTTAASTYATINNLASTGSTLYTQITSLSGYDANTYAPKSQTGSFVTTAQTGQFYAASNPSLYASTTGINTFTNTNTFQSTVYANNGVYATGNEMVISDGIGVNDIGNGANTLSLNFTNGVYTSTLYANNGIYATGNEMVISDGVGTNDIGNGANTLSLNFTNGTYISNSLVVPVIASSPTPVTGLIYFNLASGHFYGYNGSVWKQLDN